MRTMSNNSLDFAVEDFICFQNALNLANIFRIFIIVLFDLFKPGHLFFSCFFLACGHDEQSNGTLHGLPVNLHTFFCFIFDLHYNIFLALRTISIIKFYSWKYLLDGFFTTRTNYSHSRFLYLFPTFAIFIF